MCGFKVDDLWRLPQIRRSSSSGASPGRSSFIDIRFLLFGAGGSCGSSNAFGLGAPLLLGRSCLAEAFFFASGGGWRWRGTNLWLKTACSSFVCSCFLWFFSLFVLVVGLFLILVEYKYVN